MIHIEGDIVINRPVETVFDFVADECNEPRYNPEMLRAEKLSEGAIRLGTRFRAETTSRGRPLKMIIEITGYDRPHRLVSSTRMSAMDINGTLTFDACGNGTRMHWSWGLKPHGLFKLMTPFIWFVGRRQEKRIWTSMKRYLETQGPQTMHTSGR